MGKNTTIQILKVVNIEKALNSLLSQPTDIHAFFSAMENEKDDDETAFLTDRVIVISAFDGELNGILKGIGRHQNDAPKTIKKIIELKKQEKVHEFLSRSLKGRGVFEISYSGQPLCYGTYTSHAGVRYALKLLLFKH